MEMEIGELALQLPKILQEESLHQRTGAIEEVHLTVGGAQGLGHVHDLRTQRSHTGTTSDPNHLFLRVEMGMEIAVRTTHHHLVTRLQAEDIRRADACGHVLESHLRTRQEGCGGYAHGERDDIALGRIVGHRVGAYGLLGVMCLERQQVKGLPCAKIVVADETLVEVFVIVDRIVLRYGDLRIRAGKEVHVLARRQRYLELLDERRHVAVRDHRALPLLHAEDRLVDLDLEVALDLGLASETPMVLDLLAREMRALGVENLAAALEHLTLTLCATGLAATGRGQENAVGIERRHQAVALCHFQFLVIVDRDGNIAAGAEKLLGHQQNDDEQEYHDEEYPDAV